MMHQGKRSLDKTPHTKKTLQLDEYVRTIAIISIELGNNHFPNSSKWAKNHQTNLLQMFSSLTDF